MIEMRENYVYKIQHKKEKSFIISLVEEIQKTDNDDAYGIFEDLDSSENDFMITDGWGLHLSSIRNSYNVTELSPEKYPEYYI
jgi:hypothetical protein